VKQLHTSSNGEKIMRDDTGRRRQKKDFLRCADGSSGQESYRSDNGLVLKITVNRNN